MNTSNLKQWLKWNMPLAAPLANLSVYYATCLPRPKTEWTDTTTAEYLPKCISNKIKKISEALVEENT